MSEISNKLEEVAIKLRDKIVQELLVMDQLAKQERPSGIEQIKSYTSLFKLLQNLEEMVIRLEKERGRKSEKGLDILEFRQQLEEQIAKLVDQKDEAIIS